MIHVQVYHEKQREHYLVNIHRNDSFSQLKDKLFVKLEGLVEDEERVYSVFTLEMASPFAKQIKRRNHTPFDSDIVFDVIHRVERIYSGYIILKLVDVRGEGNHASGELISSTELLNQCLVSTSDKLDAGSAESCTSWATTGYNSLGGGIIGVEHVGAIVPTGTAAPVENLHSVPRLFCTPTLLDSLFMELSSMAVMQGRLSKKITNHRKQDIWREQYFILDGRMGRLWFFPIAADLSASGGSNNASNVNHTRELGASGLGVPSYISLLRGTNTRAQDAVIVSTHRSDHTSFTITISETFSVGSESVPPLSAFNSRTVTLRAPSVDKAAKWVSKLSSLHAMLRQPLLPPSTFNPRLYDPIALKFINEYAGGTSTYTAAAHSTLTAHTPSQVVHLQVAPPTLSECGGGGEGLPPVPMTARCASHWSGNSMIESIEDCVSAAQQSNTMRDADNLESLMSFEGMLKSKYLRGFFQKYLMNNCTEETLLFWEYAEDYWRAHPFSPHPFAPSSTSGSALGATARLNATNDLLAVLRQQDASLLHSPAAVRQWAESLYLTFVHFNAPYQIGCCSGKDVLRVGQAIDLLSDGEMPPFNLFRSIQQSTFNFMKTMCYPDFIAQPNYHHILVAALHASDRSAMHANVMSTCIAPDRELSTFDGYLHSAASSTNFPSASHSSGPPPVANANIRGGFMGLMRNIVGAKPKDAPNGAVEASGKMENIVAAGAAADVQSYPARWRITKLVAFELVRGDVMLTTTTSAASAASVNSREGSAKYKIGRRRDSTRSIVGDKLKKIRALQNGVYKKIGWLPEWWWDLLPSINAHEEGPSWDAQLDEVSEADDEHWGEDCFLDSAGSEQLSDAPSSSTTHRHAWSYDPECGTDWMPTDLNYLKGVFERTRQATESQNVARGPNAELHIDLLLQKQLVEEEHASDPHMRAAAVPSLFLPPGWKPSVFNNPINSAKVAQLMEAPYTLPSMMKYNASIPSFIGELNFSKGRILLEDYLHLQPVGYHRQVAYAGTGLLVLCSVARCRYLRPSQKPVNNMMLRGFRGSVAVPSADSNRSVDSGDGINPHSHSPPRATLHGAGKVSSGVRSNRSESVSIAACPLPVLSAPHVAYTRTALLQQIVRRSDEFTLPTSGNSSQEWPRQCIALYLCLGVPRLYLIDPSSLVPSASIDLHHVRRIAPTEACLHSIDIHDHTNNVWQISPEGIDAEDTREASGRWINTLSSLCLPSTSVVHIVKSGYLQKRGRLNRAFKLRWFVLCSNMKLHYYKDDQHGLLKGTIDLTSDFHGHKSGSGAPGRGSASNRDSGSAGQKQVVRFDKELVVTMQATQRMYTLQAEDVLLAEEWVNVLNDLLASPLPPGAMGPGGGVSALTGGSLIGSPGIDDLDEDDDEDD